MMQWIIYIWILDWPATDGAVACILVDECHKARYHYRLELSFLLALHWGVRCFYMCRKGFLWLLGYVWMRRNSAAA